MCLRGGLLGLSMNSKIKLLCTVGGGGEGGIRTRDTLSDIHTFQACSFNHSDTSPEPQISVLI